MIFRITDQCLHTDLTLLVALKLQSTTRRQTLYRFSRYRLFNFYLLLLYLVISLKLVNELSFDVWCLTPLFLKWAAKIRTFS